MQIFSSSLLKNIFFQFVVVNTNIILSYHIHNEIIPHNVNQNYSLKSYKYGNPIRLKERTMRRNT